MSGARRSTPTPRCSSAMPASSTGRPLPASSRPRASRRPPRSPYAGPLSPSRVTAGWPAWSSTSGRPRASSGWSAGPTWVSSMWWHRSTSGWPPGTRSGCAWTRPGWPLCRADRAPRGRPRLARVFRRAHILMASIAVGMGVLAVLGAVIFDAELVDPDGFIGPSYLRLPTVLALGFGIDLVPRTLWVARFDPRRMPEVFRERFRTHWTRDRIILVVSGILSFYVTYVSYRNLKSQLPFIEGKDHKFDRELFSMDKALFLGHEPAIVLHNLLGDGLSAEFLSSVYLWFLPLVPLALAVWLVWSSDLGVGYWFATSQCIAWTLGTVSYYALPTLGPGFQHPWLYQTIDDTNAGRLMNSLANSRVWAVNTS